VRVTGSSCRSQRSAIKAKFHTWFHVEATAGAVWKMNFMRVLLIFKKAIWLCNRQLPKSNCNVIFTYCSYQADFMIIRAAFKSGQMSHGWPTFIRVIGRNWEGENTGQARGRQCCLPHAWCSSQTCSFFLYQCLLCTVSVRLWKVKVLVWVPATVMVLLFSLHFYVLGRISRSQENTLWGLTVRFQGWLFQ
jgi:hypothetical protein